MDLKLQKELFSILEERLHAVGLETSEIPGVGGGQVGDTLRFLLPVNDEGSPVLMEIMAFSLSKGRDMLQFFTTVFTDLEEDQYNRVHEALEVWSAKCLLGSYGVYRENRQLYHKYGVPFFAVTDAGRMADEAMNVLLLVYEMLAAEYPELTKRVLGSGE